VPRQEALTIVAKLDPQRAASIPPLLEQIRREGESPAADAAADAPAGEPD